MKLNYQLKAVDFVETGRLQTNFGLLAIVWTGVTFASALGAMAGDGRLPWDPWWVLPFTGLAAAVAGLAMTTFWWAVVVPIRASYFGRQNKKLYPANTATFDVDGVTFDNSIGSSRLSWDDMRGFRENRALFLLEVSRSMGFPIPKAGMSEEQLLELRTIVGSKLKRL